MNTKLLPERATYNKAEAYDYLLSLIDQQEKVIRQQNEIILQLVNENAEQENMINILLHE